MSTALFLVQCFNGLQLGVLLFLVAAGLTLVFGVMDFINLAHGVQYMLGAYLSVAFYRLTGNFFAAVALALPASLLAGLVLEVAVFRHLYAARSSGAGAGHLRRHPVPEPGREDRVGRGASQYADP